MTQENKCCNGVPDICKGTNCEYICSEVATGQSTAEEAAKAYDEDCKKQATQLGLDWK